MCLGIHELNYLDGQQETPSEWYVVAGFIVVCLLIMWNLESEV